MSLIQQNIDDIPYDTPTRDGEFDAMLVKTFVEAAEETKEIPHKLGRIPQRVELIWSDVVIDNPQSDMIDGEILNNSEVAYLTFFESNVNVILRFS